MIPGYYFGDVYLGRTAGEAKMNLLADPSATSEVITTYILSGYETLYAIADDLAKGIYDGYDAGMWLDDILSTVRYYASMDVYGENAGIEYFPADYTPSPKRTRSSGGRRR